MPNAFPPLPWTATAVLSAVVVALWFVRTVMAERLNGSGEGPVRRDRRIKVLDATLWLAGLATAAVAALHLATELGLHLP